LSPACRTRVPSGPAGCEASPACRVENVDIRRFGKQIAGLGLFHQGRRHLPVEMRVAPGLVVDVSKMAREDRPS
jgi:hypothetical protein